MKALVAEVRSVGSASYVAPGRPLHVVGTLTDGPVAMVGRTVHVAMNDNTASWVGASLITYSESLRLTQRDPSVTYYEAEILRKILNDKITDAILAARAEAEAQIAQNRERVAAAKAARA